LTGFGSSPAPILNCHSLVGDGYLVWSHRLLNPARRVTPPHHTHTHTQHDPAGPNPSASLSCDCSWKNRRCASVPCLAAALVVMPQPFTVSLRSEWHKQLRPVLCFGVDAALGQMGGGGRGQAVFELWHCCLLAMAPGPFDERKP
jgi:hypothetical protein